MRPLYANSVIIKVASSGNFSGETTLEFRHMYKTTGVDESGNYIPGENMNEEVATLVVSPAVAKSIRDALNGVVTNSMFREINPN